VRLSDGPVAALKLASGCDRRCTFCAIPSFRGAFVSRRPSDVLAEARWLADQGARELFLVSENSTSYGKDLGDLRGHHPGGAVERLGATDEDVEALVLDGGGDGPGRAQRIGSRERRVGDQDSALGAHRERFADGVVGLLRTHRHHRYLSAGLLSKLETLFDAVLVALVHDQLNPVTDKPVVVTELGRGVGVGGLLHGHENVHAEILKIGRGHTDRQKRRAVWAAQIVPAGALRHQVSR